MNNTKNTWGLAYHDFRDVNGKEYTSIIAFNDIEGSGKGIYGWCTNYTGLTEEEALSREGNFYHHDY